MGAVVSTSEITPAEREPFAGIPPVEAVDYETSPEKRDRTLKHLLRANHHNYSVLYSQLRFHNHLPHVGLLLATPEGGGKTSSGLIEV